ncbi:MAG: type II toxin-antitoxin system prevent-host-death family antitoxin [Oscillospiraceae bacterium]|nr:type II toxin-antitoxin system prevent-host-death family antitoxin [Oscillospiraceae bacterium]
MPNIKPVSDLRNYNEVLKNVDMGQPVFLTKNGRGRYAVLDMREYEATQATMKLITELSKGEQSAKEKGWRTAEEVEARLGIM